MAFKTLLTVLTSPRIEASALEDAIVLARGYDAHLEVICLGLDRSHAAEYQLGVNATVMHAAIEQAHEKAEKIQSAARPVLENSGVRWDISDAVSMAGDAGRAVVHAGRFADMAVLPLPYGEDVQSEDSAVLEALLIDAHCPVCVVPPKATAPATPETVMIAWNESPEALRAIRAALPVLQSAASVHIAIIDPPAHGTDRSDPGGALATWLSRHGVHCDIQIMSRSGGKVSDRLAQHALETGAGLLVMGGYGHSRFREAVLGGATRYMLENARVPVLMMH
ncbi:universal stress protein [uncultured Roseobacter sp.]|uniref:universal stress protein n=1 Tax=uncultured Roseobacter sp. TaxID=114847 RepID=UPI002609056A|nr:universal stress protein [uncultured Roseobacter sp.]